MKIGILRETKTPPDKRVPLVPWQLRCLQEHYPDVSWVVQSSPIRAFTDTEYESAGIQVVSDIADCDILLGVKEIEKDSLLTDKTYLFFSHTAKFQEYNQPLLAKLASLANTLIDYEYLVKNGVRVVAFGYWAGVVGAYNALLGNGLSTGDFNLKPAHKCKDLEEMEVELKKVKFSTPQRIVVTGEGRVASGAIEILEQAKVKRVSPETYLKKPALQNVYCQIGPQHYTIHREGKAFSFDDFVSQPEKYDSAFAPFTNCSDMFIACHFWDEKSPVFFTQGDMKKDDFRIRFIADVSCDIQGPIPTTLRASTIELPFYGVDLQTGDEIEAFQENQLTVMAVDNLPAELPRDASIDFGEKLIEHVFPELLSVKNSEMIHQATILEKGELTKKFSYLNEFLAGNY